MQGHHQIEDFQYFPAFRRDEPQLAPGFERLEAEHAQLTRDVAAAEAALARLRAAAEPTGDAGGATLAVAADRYIAAARQLCERLGSHLADEEDLVIPLLSEHGHR
jgi:hemerythrin-like domain-containing protein